jgi:hypothetical protein
MPTRLPNGALSERVQDALHRPPGSLNCRSSAGVLEQAWQQLRRSERHRTGHQGGALRGQPDPLVRQRGRQLRTGFRPVSAHRRPVAVLYASGEKAAGVRRFGYRLGGERGESAVVLAGQAARAVALGVGVTASSSRFSVASAWPSPAFPSPRPDRTDVHVLHRPAWTGTGAGAGRFLAVLE